MPLRTITQPKQNSVKKLSWSTVNQTKLMTILLFKSQSLVAVNPILLYTRSNTHPKVMPIFSKKTARQTKFNFQNHIFLKTTDLNSYHFRNILSIFKMIC